MCFSCVWVTVFSVCLIVDHSKMLKNSAVKSVISRDVCCTVLSFFSPVQLCVTLWTLACPAPLSIGFSRQKYWRGCALLQGSSLPRD